jgi:hypothetical protein
VIAGTAPGGKNAGAAAYGRWSPSDAPPGGDPNLKVLKIADRDAVFYSPVDLSATVNGHFIHDMPAYQPAYARQLVGNLALLRYSQLHP